MLVMGPLLVACSSGVAEPTQTTAQPLVTTCAGSFTCTGGDSPVKPVLTRTSAGCDVGGIHLTPDGNASDDKGDHYTWTGDTSDFKVCVDGKCLDCKNDAAPASSGSGASAAGGKCTGAAFSCYGLGAGSCSAQSGCYSYEHVHYDGSTELECAGTSDDCSQMASQKTCNGQTGCKWEPN
jgi:hypothetical protein